MDKILIYYMRQTDGSMRTVSLGTISAGTSEFIKLTDIDDEERPICNRMIDNYSAHILIGFTIIGTGIVITVLYIVNNV